MTPAGARPAPPDGSQRLVVEVDAEWPFDPPAAFRAGVRVVALDRPVDLVRPVHADVRALDVVRQATGSGLHVSWVLRTRHPAQEAERLSHLHPPTGFDQPQAADPLGLWRRNFYLGRCCWRQGPGFVQVRDRRRGGLAKYTITDPELLRVWYALDAGDRNEDPAAAARLVDVGLVLALGDLAWLAPYRLVRWPTPATGV